MIKAVIFDMDGTLIDTEKYYRMFWPKALAEFGYEMTDEQVLSIRSLGRPFAPVRFKEWYGEDFDYYAVRNRRKELMNEYLEGKPLEIKPGAEKILQILNKKGIMTAVATASNIAITQKYLEQTGLKKYFTKLISASMVKAGKPAPDIYEYACMQLGVNPDECIAVEDAPNGIKAAYSAGCRVIMVPDQTEPDDEISPYLYACVKTLDKIEEFI